MCPRSPNLQEAELFFCLFVCFVCVFLFFCFFFKTQIYRFHSPQFSPLCQAALSLRTWLISQFKGERTETQRGHLADAPGPRGWPPAVNPSVVSLPSCAPSECRRFQPQLGASLTHQARREPAVWGLSTAHGWVRNSP